MKENHLAKILIEKLKEKGKEAEIIPIKYLHRSMQEIAEKHHSGLIPDRLFQSHFKDFDRESAGTKKPAQSMIITAAPQPQVRLDFSMDGRSFKAIIPPTYRNHTDQEVKQLIRNVIEPYGYTLGDAQVPLKLLAVASELARYGRNNITYIKGLGSFFRLKAFYSDLIPEKDNWQPYRMTDQCAGCHACLKACPTGAISKKRFLIHTDRCLTFLNETPPDLPEWVSPEWHNCLVGCMRCQAVCPLNKDFKLWIEDRPRFSAEETRLVLEENPDCYPHSLNDKLGKLNLTEYKPLLSRNLRTLLRLTGRR